MSQDHSAIQLITMTMNQLEYEMILSMNLLEYDCIQPETNQA